MSGGEAGKRTAAAEPESRIVMREKKTLDPASIIIS
jgi:hypothetical protein